MLKASLARRFTIFNSLLILATSLSLSLFILAREQTEEDAKIRQRGISLTRNIAHNAELGVLTRNADLLKDLADGLLQEVDIRSVTVTDMEGVPLFQSHASGDSTHRLAHRSLD
jgi:sensor histidine kinase regulating citrate/malate metabolism